MLHSLDDYFLAKNLRYCLIPSRSFNDQRTLQSGWLQAFWVVIEEPRFFQTYNFQKNITNIVIHNLYGKKRLRSIKFLAKSENSILE